MTSKGWVDLVIASVAGLIIGTAMMYAVSQQLQIEKQLELYSADLDTLHTLYQGRNIQEYIKLDKMFVTDYIESGGPRKCGTIYFNEKEISVLKTNECEITFSDELVKNEAGKIASLVAQNYVKDWKITTKSKENTFCIVKARQISFGNYISEICFDSTFEAFSGPLIQGLLENLNSPDACACFSTYKVCWKDLIVGDYSGNFTYALEENC